ncbi:MAG: B12-binding domain-containing radical SAM protein [Phycisphaerae bacterium]|nr:B12-binding domain-containing radical SAM protein [Phycisphaerae bacterium]
MKILLIAPASGNWKKIAARRFFNGKTFRFSMTALLTVAKLSPADADITLVDEQIEDIPFNDRYDLVGITCMTATAPRAFELCAYFRSRHIPVVLGGFFPSLNPEAALEHADAVVVGPAMEAWPALCEDFHKGRLEKIYHGNPNGKVPSMLPRNLIRTENYSTANATYATMGCKNKCKFCSISAVYKANHYTRPIDDVIAEVASFDSKFFMFVDDNLTQNREYVLELLERLAPLKKHWVTQASIEIADDEELLDKLKKGGCIGVFIGLESFNAHTLNETEKGFNAPEKYRRAVKTLHRHGLFVQSGVIFGFDDDTVEVFSTTLNMLERIGIDAIQVAVLTPLPGTVLYEDMKDRMIDTNYEHYDYRHVVFQPKRMGAEQLQAGADWVIRKYYAPWRILRRTVRWLCTRGLSHYTCLFVVNWAYFGRTVAFGIKGYNPAKRKIAVLDYLTSIVKRKRLA